MGLVKPLLPRLSGKSRRTVTKELASWLWGELAFQQYAPVNDEDYQLALGIHLELALTAKTPDDVLQNLWRMTRWLELLGAGGVAQWVRQLIRTEAPGTRYVDKSDRERYVRKATLSPNMKDYLSGFEEQVKANATEKLRQMLGGSHTLEDAGPLLVEED